MPFIAQPPVFGEPLLLLLLLLLPRLLLCLRTCNRPGNKGALKTGSGEFKDSKAVRPAEVRLDQFYKVRRLFTGHHGGVSLQSRVLSPSTRDGVPPRIKGPAPRMVPAATLAVSTGISTASGGSVTPVTETAAAAAAATTATAAARFPGADETRVHQQQHHLPQQQQPQHAPVASAAGQQHHAGAPAQNRPPDVGHAAAAASPAVSRAQQQTPAAATAAAPAAAAAAPHVIPVPAASRAAAPGSKLSERGAPAAAADSVAAAAKGVAPAAAAAQPGGSGETGQGDKVSSVNSALLPLPVGRDCEFDRSLRPDLDVHLLLKGQPTPVHPRQQQQQQQQQHQPQLQAPQQHGDCGAESPAYISDCGAELGALPSVASLSGTLGCLIREHAAKEAGAAAAEAGAAGEQDLHCCPNCLRPLLLCPCCRGRALQLNLIHGKVVIECLTCSSSAAASSSSAAASTAAATAPAAAADPVSGSHTASEATADATEAATASESPAAPAGSSRPSSSSSGSNGGGVARRGVYTHCWECNWDFSRSAELLTASEAAVDGVLLKKGKHLHQWQARFYVLIDNMLYYYKKKGDAKPRGFMFLEGCFVETIPDAGALRPHGFAIVYPKGDSVARRALYAQSAQEQQEWVDALRASTRQQSLEHVYDVHEQLGQGKFSVVYRGVHVKTKEQFAIKVIDKGKINRHERELLRSEMVILRLLNHPNVIRLKEMVDTKETLYIVMELVRGGELFDLVHANHHLPEVHVNRYVAPEVLTLEGYNQQVDVWSIGVITYLLLRGRLPFPINKHLGSPHFHQTYPLTFEGPVWRAISSSAKDLIRRMLDPDPRARITVEEALQHMWIKNPTAVINEANKTDPFDHINPSVKPIDPRALAAADGASTFTIPNAHNRLAQQRAQQLQAKAAGAPAAAAAAAAVAAAAAAVPRAALEAHEKELATAAALAEAAKASATPAASPASSNTQALASAAASAAASASAAAAAAAAAAATAAADAVRPLGAAAAPLTPGEDSGKGKPAPGSQPHAATGAPAAVAAAAVAAATAATEPAAAGAPAAIAADTAANAKETAKAAAAAAHSAAAVAQAAAAAAALHAAATDEAFAAVQRNPSGESAARRAGPGEQQQQQQQQQQTGLATPSPASAVGPTSLPPNVAAAAPAEAAFQTAASTSAPLVAGRPVQQGAAAGLAAAGSSKPPAGP
ncbi:hypothetical protein Emag_005178 [Eimeria magna]